MPAETMIAAAHLSPMQRLGTRVDGCFTAADVMTEGHLGGWNVRKAPIYARVDELGGQIQVPGRAAVLRDNPFTPGQIDVMGDVGANYGVVQNEDHVTLLDAIVDESGANFELAGATNGGKQVFVSMKLPQHIQVGGVDPVNVSLLALNSHDASLAFSLAVKPVRYACSNVITPVVGRTPHTLRVKHTSGALDRIVGQAREALGITFKYLDRFQAEAERLIDTTMTDSQFEEIVTRAFGAPEDASVATVTRAQGRIGQMTQLFAHAETQENIRGTAWAGYNALTEWFDHYSPVRGREDHDAARATRALLDDKFATRALQLVTA